jgi:hypothetical protein
MTEIEPDTLGFGTVFEYPDPLSRNKLNEWLEKNDYDIIEENPGEFALGPEGIQISQPSQEGIAQKDNIRILYNPNASLDGFAESSFITVKNAEGADFDSVQSETQRFWEALDEEFQISDQVALLELTYQGRIRIDSQANLSYLFDDSVLEGLSALGGSRGEGKTARFESELDPRNEGWFKFTIDADHAGNPRVWGFKLVRRFSSYENVSGEEIRESIIEFVDQTKE